MPAQTHSQLTAADRRTAHALQGMLVDLIDLTLIGKQARWNVSDPRPGVTGLLDDLVEAWRALADDVAERAASLEAAVNGQGEAVAVATRLAPLPTGRLADDAALETIGKRAIDVAGRTRQRIDAIADDFVTRELLVGIAELLVEHRCMLQRERERLS